MRFKHPRLQPLEFKEQNSTSPLRARQTVSHTWRQRDALEGREEAENQSVLCWPKFVLHRSEGQSVYCSTKICAAADLPILRRAITSCRVCYSLNCLLMFSYYKFA